MREREVDTVYVTMPQAGFKPTKVGVTGFQLNVKRTLYLQTTIAGLTFNIIHWDFVQQHNCIVCCQNRVLYCECASFYLFVNLLSRSSSPFYTFP